MFHNTSGAVLLAAMASASGYAAADTDATASASAQRAAVGADLRNAQVALYLDHNQEAITAIRRAEKALPSGTDAGLLAALDEAAWEARHDHFDAAVAALDSAIGRLHA